MPIQPIESFIIPELGIKIGNHILPEGEKYTPIENLILIALAVSHPFPPRSFGPSTKFPYRKGRKSVSPHPSSWSVYVPLNTWIHLPPFRHHNPLLFSYPLHLETVCYSCNISRNTFLFSFSPTPKTP